MIHFQIHIQVVIEETGIPLPGLFVKAYDKDFLFDDLLGSVITDKQGKGDIICDRGDFNEFFDKRPDVYFRIYAPDHERVLFETSDAVKWNADRNSFFVVRVPLIELYGAHAEPSVQLFNNSGRAREDSPPAVGSSLMISAKGLAPAAAHQIELSDDDGVLFVSTLMTNQYGELAESALWPQFGLDDPRSNTIYTVDEAEKKWRNKKLHVQVSHKESAIAKASVAIGAFNNPFLINVDKKEKMLNGFEQGKGRITIAGYNIFHNDDVRVFLVRHQADWNVGDSFTPEIFTNGKLAMADARPDKQGRFTVTIGNATNIMPGAYDFIVRRLRYGYGDEEDLTVRLTDVVTRRVTGLVVRQEFWASKVVHLGCVNMMPLSGRVIFGPPYYRYGDAFAEGEDVYAAVDPAALPPVNIGKMAAIYVVQSKTAAQWDADKSLNHLAVLGGNAATIKFKTQVGCINHNSFLVWPAASIVGSYDIIIDFGNNSSDPMTFVPDNQYTIAVPPAVGDIIDGYMVPGFRIVKDPGIITDPAFSNVGAFDYTQGSITVQTDSGATVTVPLTARVRFPADIPGATTPAQISAVKASYPMTIIVHGQGHTYLAYDYLLDHWAANGFIAASILIGNSGDQCATDRAKVLFAHIEILKTKFGVKAENNIGIMGHSRGGEGVATAPRLNQQGALGYNFNAVISLAPTNQYVDEHIIPPWATPYYVIYGSLDADVTGEFGPGQLRNCGFALYDKAAGAKKGMLFVAGATHDRFLAPPGNVDLDYGWLTPADQANALSANAHHAVALAYMTAYFRQQLLNDMQFVEMFEGEWVPPSVATVDGGKAKLYTQYQDIPANRKIMDDFEEAHTATSWQNSTIGGGVTQTGLAANPTENFLYVADSAHSPHNASGLVAHWDSSGDRLEYAIPTAQKNITGFKALSFRVTQKYDPTGTINPLNLDQNFYVLLHDAVGMERMVQVSKFGRVSYPFLRDNGWIGSVVKSALATIRIPLHAYTIECAGAQRVDLTQVDKLGFIFQANASGEIEVDDIEFTN